MSNKEVLEYINKIELEDRKHAISMLKDTIYKNIPKGFEECISYNMIGYVVPKTIYPKGYHCNTSLPLPFIAIGNQKNFIALHHMGIYADAKLLDWFVAEYPKHCKYKLDMGKGCIRFKKMEDIPYKLIAELVKKITTKQWIDLYEHNLTTHKK